MKSAANPLARSITALARRFLYYHDVAARNRVLSFLPEVREFIKDTRPKTNTTRGGRFAATVGTCFYSITCPPSWPLFPLQDKKRLVFEGTVGAATRPLSSSSPRTTSASSSRTKARAAATPHSWGSFAAACPALPGTSVFMAGLCAQRKQRTRKGCGPGEEGGSLLVAGCIDWSLSMLSGCG